MLPLGLSPYEILGIDPSASTEDVRRAYRRKALETHPDKLDAQAKHEEKLHTEDQFRMVCEAFEILGDPQKRQVYDSTWKFQRRSKSTNSEELDRRMRERQEWAEKLAEHSSRRQSTTAESDQSIARRRTKGGHQRTHRHGEQANEECSREPIECDRYKRLLKERQEWAQKQEEQHQKRMESITQQSIQQDQLHQELVKKLVKEMAEALNDAIPGWLERKRKVEQIRVEQFSKAKLAGQHK